MFHCLNNYLSILRISLYFCGTKHIFCFYCLRAGKWKALTVNCVCISGVTLSRVKNVVWSLALRLHVNEERAFTFYVNILINKLLTDSVYICFVNRDQCQEAWTGRGKKYTSPPLRKTSSPLCYPSLPPSVSVFRRAGSICFVGLPVFQHLCAGLMLCCDCLVQVTSQKGR